MLECRDALFWCFVPLLVYLGGRTAAGIYYSFSLFHLLSDAHVKILMFLNREYPDVSVRKETVMVVFVLKSFRFQALFPAHLSFFTPPFLSFSHPRGSGSRERV